MSQAAAAGPRSRKNGTFGIFCPFLGKIPVWEPGYIMSLVLSKKNIFELFSETWKKVTFQHIFADFLQKFKENSSTNLRTKKTRIFKK
jgi:hypothetical protein